tara:strand:- start:360 stop:497 length:138 start_codon:yes stop_codon:yes gene_type:complete
MPLFHESINYPKLIKIEFFKISGLVKGYVKSMRRRSNPRLNWLSG